MTGEKNPEEEEGRSNDEVAQSPPATSWARRALPQLAANAVGIEQPILRSIDIDSSALPFRYPDHLYSQVRFPEIILAASRAYARVLDRVDDDPACSACPAPGGIVRTAHDEDADPAFIEGRQGRASAEDGEVSLAQPIGFVPVNGLRPMRIRVHQRPIEVGCVGFSCRRSGGHGLGFCPC